MSEVKVHHSRTILHGVWQQASQQPDRMAVRMGTIGYTYQQLIERSERIAQMIGARNLARQRIGLYLSNHPDFLCAFYGCVRAGAIAVPLPADLLREQLDDYKKHLNLTEVWDHETVDEYLEEKSHENQPTVFEHQPNVKQISADGLFYMAVSSGSTGRPKGILRNHRSWVISFDAMYEAFGIGLEDTMLIPGPLHYSASLIAALQVLDRGGEVVLLPFFQAESVMDQLLSGQITSTFLVPTMIAKLLSMLADQTQMTPIFRTLPLKIVSAGAKLDLTLKKAWLSCFKQSQLYEYYGAAELSFVSYISPDDQLTVGNSVGKAFPQTKLVIRSDAGKLCEVGEVGEVYVQSEMIAQAYGHQVAEKFLLPQEGYYTVGDMGYLDKAGYLFLTGRKQDMILRGGVNIYPLEIERVLNQHLNVAEVVVLGIPDQVMGECIVAAIVESNQEERKPSEVKLMTRQESKFHSWVRHHLQQSRWPDYYLIVEQLPLGSAGKADKETLRNWIVTSK
ncbi:class I adenylate-forming enzyme family protein [Brevibacillus ginsengisoli]|uniref:class I adenylate-forming enzyme family protein n=1 Tax=Brevibacillus ginsengisoli TaxID=363854 RepID=UPI003CF885F5